MLGRISLRSKIKQNIGFFQCNYSYNLTCLPAGGCALWRGAHAHKRGAFRATPYCCAVGDLTDFVFACLLKKQIELNVG